MGKKLNLKWVTETIGEDYKTWEKGDTVILEAQTGTGKSYFITGDEKKSGLIDRIKPYENMMYICNRINLKRQFKKDLLKKFNLDIPKEMEELDKINRIKNIVITSYHALAERQLENIYLGKNNNLDDFDYIIADECHFVLADSNFNNKCDLAFYELIMKSHKNAIKVFISATVHEIKEAIIKKSDKISHIYSTGIDYSYLDTYYFRNLKDIIQLIKNDLSEDKWLIFVTKKDDAKKIDSELKNIHKASIIVSGTKSKELTNIINESKFESKVLICTKAMDNGINIKDDNVKNIVVMAWDRITFIQELGRVRVNISDASTVKLYIPMSSKGDFTKKINIGYQPKIEMTRLYMKDIQEFNKLYDRDFHKLPKDLFYKNITQWKINEIGRARLVRDYTFASKIEERFENEGELAYIKEQLEWLELTFNEKKLIKTVKNNSEIELLDTYLENIVGKKLFKGEQEEITNCIKELKTIGNEIDTRTKSVQPNKLQQILNKVELQYKVSEPQKETRGEMKGKRYIIITK